jgi:hypothetical protein
VKQLTTRYKQWTPEPFDPGTDPLSAQVGARESEDVIRDPEADAAPTITRVGNAPPQPRPVEISSAGFHEPSEHPDTPVTVDRVDATAHLQGGQPSTDPHSDDMLNRVEGVAHHKGVLRRRDARGREAFSIRFLDPAGNVRTQAIDARSLEAADEALTVALAQPGREPIR